MVLLTLSLPISVVNAQDCGDFQFRLSLTSYPTGTQFTFQLDQDCPNYRLLLEEGTQFEIFTTDTVLLEAEEVIDFVKTIERIPTDQLNSYQNEFLADGVSVNYFYNSRQGYGTSGELSFPLTNKESWMLLQEELWVFSRFYQLFAKELSAEGRTKLEKEFSTFLHFFPD